MRVTRPTEASLRLVTECAARNHPSDPRLVDWYDAYSRGHAVRIAQDLDMVQVFADKNSSILEIGALPFLLSAPLKQLGYDLDCLDLAPERFEDTIREFGLTVYSYDIEMQQGELPPRRYDLIILNEVFEHLRTDLIQTMTLIRSLLNPGGRLLLSTPNLRSLEGIVNLLRHSRGSALGGEIFAEYSKITKYGHMGHVREYAAGDVTRFLQDMGFEIEDVIFRSHLPHHRALGRIVRRLMPSLSPFVTVVAKRGADRPAA